jgi:hypothetical protein
MDGMEGPIETATDKASLDQLLAGREPQNLFAKRGLIDDLKEALRERMLDGSLEDHLESQESGCRRYWDQVILFFAFSPPIRRVIYAPNVIEPLQSKVRRAVRMRGISRVTRQPCSRHSLSLTGRSKHGSDRRANGVRPRPNSPSCSAIGSWPDEQKRSCAHNYGWVPR